MALNTTQLLYRVVGQLSLQYKNKDLSLFLVRLGANFNDLLKLYDHLYGQHESVEQHLIELILAMAEMYLERSDELRDLDVQREQDKGWYMSPNWVATMLYVDRYAENLKGFQQKIDYLDELGINYVHLMPLLKMPSGANDGGYAITDYRSVDERFGSMDDIRDIAKIFRAKDMLLELDLVLNHSSDEHEWVKKALDGEKEYQDMYYLYDDRSIPDLFEKTLPEVFPTTAPGNFTYIESLNKWVFTTFNNFQWDLNYSNPKVFTEMTKILFHLTNQGVDILRLDAVAFMWKRLGTDCQNLEEAHLLLQMFKCCAKIVAPGVLFKAEAIVQPDEIVKYLGGGNVDECEIAYNASFMVYLWDAMATQNKLVMEQGLRNIPRLPAGTTWINYIRCHDDIGLGYSDADIMNAGFNPFDHRQFIISHYVGEYPGSTGTGQRFMYNPKTLDARITGSTASLLGLENALENKNTNQVDAAISKILLMHGMIMSIGGIPLVYYGDEVACVNDYSYLEEKDKMDDSRWLNRPIIDWNKVELRKKNGSIEQRVFDGLKKMIALRKTLPEFNNENDYLLVDIDNPSLFAFTRHKSWNRTLVVANMSPTVQYLAQAAAEKSGFVSHLYDIYGESDFIPAYGQYELQPYQFVWLKQQ
jgi:amylosucrase